VYFLIALIVAVSLFLAIRTWRGYEVAYRSGPNGEETIDVSSAEPFIIPSGDGFNTLLLLILLPIVVHHTREFVIPVMTLQTSAISADIIELKRKSKQTYPRSDIPHH